MQHCVVLQTNIQVTLQTRQAEQHSCAADSEPADVARTGTDCTISHLVADKDACCRAVLKRMPETKRFHVGLPNRLELLDSQNNITPPVETIQESIEKERATTMCTAPRGCGSTAASRPSPPAGRKAARARASRCRRSSDRRGVRDGGGGRRLVTSEDALVLWRPASVPPRRPAVNPARPGREQRSR